jgi:hypothetical protein
MSLPAGIMGVLELTYVRYQAGIMGLLELTYVRYQAGIMGVLELTYVSSNTPMIAAGSDIRV